MAEEHIPEEEIREGPEDASSEDESIQVSRRQFLVGAGAGAVIGVAAGAGVVSLRSGGGQAPAAVREEAAPAPAAPGAPVVEVAASDLPATLRAVTLNIDGKSYDVVVDVRESLWDTMVGTLNHSSVNIGCDRAQCGACAVVIDGRAVNGCTVLSARLGRGQEILTVDGLSTGTTIDQLHPIQRAFWQQGGYQCGICTRGFIMSTYALLEQNPDPSEEDVREALAGNICRCSEYPKIYDSVFKAAEEMRA